MIKLLELKIFLKIEYTSNVAFDCFVLRNNQEIPLVYNKMNNRYRQKVILPTIRDKVIHTFCKYRLNVRTDSMISESASMSLKWKTYSKCDFMIHTMPWYS